MKKKFIFFQVGAREAYFLPFALCSNDVEVTLVTDYFRPTTSTEGNYLSRKYKPKIVQIYPLFALAYILQKLRAGWFGIEVTNFFAGLTFTLYLLCYLAKEFLVGGSKIVVGSFSYTALLLAVVSKIFRIKFLLFQIDGGEKEHKIIRAKECRSSLHYPSSLYFFLWKMELLLADDIIVNSGWSRGLILSAKVLNRLVCTDDRVHIVPLTVGMCSVSESNNFLSKFHKISALINKKKDSFIVLFIGQVIARKGVPELIDAARVIASLDSSIKFVIVGGYGLSENFLTHIPSNVILTGPIPRDSVSSFYRVGDLFVLPTHSDGFALTQLEAGLHGLPSLVSRFCGDVIVDGFNGRILPSVNSETLIDYILRCKLDCKQLRYDSSAIKRFTESAFCDDSYRNKILDLILNEK